MEAPPYHIECRRIFGHMSVDAVNTFGKIAEIIFRLGLDKFVETVGNHAVDNSDGSDGADARRLIVGGLDIYSDKIFHFTSSMSHRGVEVAPQMPMFVAFSIQLLSISSALEMNRVLGFTSLQLA